MAFTLPSIPDPENVDLGQVTGINIDWENFDPTKPFQIPLSSTCCASARYDPIGEFLFLEFTDGSGYEYQGVPQWVVTDLVQSSSVGRYFNYQIRDQYTFDQLYWS